MSLIRLAPLVTTLLGAAVALAAPPPKTIAKAVSAPLPSTSLPSGAPILPLADVKPGMRGYGLTVFAGTKPERFNVVVVGVLRNFLPKQDIILVRSDDERLIHSGIVAGMSGSPVFIDGKCMGAVAYGWSFSKDPIAGVTPIESMLNELKRPLRGRGTTPAMYADAETSHESLDEVLARRSSVQSALPLFGRLPLPPSLSSAGTSSLVRTALPLSVAGVGPDVVKELDDALHDHNIVAMQGAGGARSDHAPLDHYEDGGAIAVQLIRGDVSAVGVGTVTYVKGNQLVAFGHPMFSAGESYLPTATAEIFTFMSSLASSFKIASPIQEVGSLIQDRPSCIAADASLHTDMIPVTASVHAPGIGDGMFNAEVARHRFLTPMLVATVLSGATHQFAADITDSTVTVRSHIELAGQAPLDLTESMFSIDGASGRALGGTTGLRSLSELVLNGFAPPHFDRIDFKIEIEHKSEIAEIVAVALADGELEPGSRPSLYVTLRPYHGNEFVQTIPFDVPRNLAGQGLKLVAASGAQTKPDVAPPETFTQLIDNYRKSYSARSIVLSIELPDEGVTLRGRYLQDLPSSVVDTLRPSVSSRRGEVVRKQQRIVVPMPQIIAGKQEVAARVRELPSLTR